MPSVSHSEAETYNECKRKHHYAYTRSLEPVSMPLGMEYGTAGHRMLEAYYGTLLKLGGQNKLKQRRSHREGVLAAMREYDKLLKEGWQQPESRYDLKDLVTRYLASEPFVKRGWKVLATEQRYAVEYDDEQHLSYPFVVDVWMEDPTGKTVVVDHKFLSEFYTPQDIKHLPQIPKYIGALRGLNHKVDYGVYNMLRTYNFKSIATDSQLFRIERDTPNGIRIQRVFQDQVELARQIQSLKALSLEEQDRQAIRTGFKNTCKSCWFSGLCEAELVGAPTKLMLRTEYRQRTRREFDVTADA